MMINNKKAWIKIVESFVAVLLIAAVLLTMINTDLTKKEDISEKMYKTEDAILKNVLLDDNLRSEIISKNSDWDLTKAKIGETTPGYLRCVSTICAISQKDDLVAGCYLGRDDNIRPSNEDTEIYTKSAIIMANKNNDDIYTKEPTMIRLFCWLKAEDV